MKTKAKQLSQPANRGRLVTTAGWLLAVLLLAGCSQTPPTPYATAYKDALGRYPGTMPVTDASVDRFIAFFSHHQAAAGAEPVDPAAMYADRFYFSDTLVTTEDPALALAHLRRMRSSAEDLEVRLLNRLDDGADVYLIWQMLATFTPVRSPVTSNTIGMTHLRFDDAGRIVLHQDFWDASEGFYQHVPVLGSIIHRIRRGFDHDDQ